MSGAINIYASNIFAILSDNNCLAELLNVEQYNAHKSGMVLMERNRFLEIINQTRENELMYSEGITEVSAKLKKHVQREEHLIKELNMYKQAYENTISSTAWKITFPLRKIMDKLKRRNRRYEGD